MPVIDDIRLRRGTLSEWAAANPTLNDGEVGLIIDRKSFIVGDGASQFSSLRPWLDGRVLAASSLTALATNFSTTGTTWVTVLSATTPTMLAGDVLVLRVELLAYISQAAANTVVFRLVVGGTNYNLWGFYTPPALTDNRSFARTFRLTGLTGPQTIAIQTILYGAGYVSIHAASSPLNAYAQISQEVWRQ